MRLVYDAFGTHAGYERMLAGWSPRAVRWWYSHEDGDYRFARGGLVRTARHARRAIDTAARQMERERKARLEALRPRFALHPDGTLTPTEPLT